MTKIGNVAVTKIKCEDCGKVFVMAPKEVKWYTQHMGWPLPKRCPTCRKARRKQKGVKA